MRLLPRRISHLSRYFALLGIPICLAYVKGWNDRIFLVLVGPCIYLAHALRGLVVGYGLELPQRSLVNNYFFLLPVTVAYYGVLGFLFKNLWNERGFIRGLSLLAFVGFLLFIHYAAWHNILSYFG